MKLKENEYVHIGLYGVLIRKNKILLINKFIGDIKEFNAIDKINDDFKGTKC